MKQTTCHSPAYQEHDSALHVKIIAMDYEPPAPTTRKCHKRNQTRRLFIQPLLYLDSTTNSTPELLSSPSPGFNDLTSLPSTAIESAGSSSECQATIAYCRPEADLKDLLTDLQINMRNVLNKDSTHAQSLMAKRISARKVLYNYLKQRVISGYGYSTPSISVAMMKSPSQKRVKWVEESLLRR